MRKKVFEEQIVHIKYCTGLTEVAQWLKKKNLPANAGDPGLIPGWEDPQEKEVAAHSSILA